MHFLLLFFLLLLLPFFQSFSKLRVLDVYWGGHLLLRADLAEGVLLMTVQTGKNIRGPHMVVCELKTSSCDGRSIKWERWQNSIIRSHAFNNEWRVSDHLPFVSHRRLNGLNTRHLIFWGSIAVWGMNFVWIVFLFEKKNKGRKDYRNDSHHSPGFQFLLEDELFCSYLKEKKDLK